MVIYWKIVLSFLIVAMALSALAIPQKISMGVPLVEKGYAVPFVGGGLFGALIGSWRQIVKESEELFLFMAWLGK